MSHHQQSEWLVLVAGMDRIGSSMRNSKCQELSNPPSSGLGSKDSRSYDEKSDSGEISSHFSSSPTEVGQSCVE